MKPENNYRVLDSYERLRTELIGLFRAHGYVRYRMEKFESYDIYRVNKDYIDGTSIVTFTDSQGKLLALRPDVTLSVVNNLPADAGHRKYFYDESVFRRDKKGDYRELRQIGVENIGGKGIYPECEAALLAVKALNLLGEECVLSIGHMDAAEALIKRLELSDGVYACVLECIKSKALHELRSLLADCADKKTAQALIALAGLEGDAYATLAQAEKLVSGTQAAKAVLELKEVFGVLKDSGYGHCVKPDFSLIDDYRYYNGIVFRGYVRGASTSVITGGRYDNMLRRMGKNARAVGFALDVAKAAGLLKDESLYDVVVVDNGASSGELAAAVKSYVSRGLRTTVLDFDDTTVRARKRVYLGGSNQ